MHIFHSTVVLSAFASIMGIVPALEPTEIYTGGYNTNTPPVLKIANGGAGQSGLVKGRWTCKLSDRSSSFMFL
jgi:hypothetical protein